MSFLGDNLLLFFFNENFAFFCIQLWSMKDTDVLCLHFAVNYRYLMCQSKHILGMLGSSEKCNYAS